MVFAAASAKTAQTASKTENNQTSSYCAEINRIGRNRQQLSSAEHRQAGLNNRGNANKFEDTGSLGYIFGFAVVEASQRF